MKGVVLVDFHPLLALCLSFIVCHFNTLLPLSFPVHVISFHVESLSTALVENLIGKMSNLLSALLGLLQEILNITERVACGIRLHDILCHYMTVYNTLNTLCRLYPQVHYIKTHANDVVSDESTRGGHLH